MADSNNVSSVEEIYSIELLNALELRLQFLGLTHCFVGWTHLLFQATELFSNASLLSSAIRLISFATTENPLPDSPALAASMVDLPQVPLIDWQYLSQI
ncbi:hypothetical protein [Niallia sp. Krafla_26]|uniref:hypothetical protein n=1 Tax=Niallia sp. Krafla_26 TaxID=3064703 RepID=UPI003D181F79